MCDLCDCVQQNFTPSAMLSGYYEEAFSMSFLDPSPLNPNHHTPLLGAEDRIKLFCQLHDMECTANSDNMCLSIDNDEEQMFGVVILEDALPDTLALSVDNSPLHNLSAEHINTGNNANIAHLLIEDTDRVYVLTDSDFVVLNTDGMGVSLDVQLSSSSLLPGANEENPSL